MAENQNSNQYLLLSKEDFGLYSSESHPILNIVLVGRTGNGKSATGNTIIGAKVFESKSNAGGVTMECKTHRVLTPDGEIFNVIDTPGLFDLTLSAEFISEEIVRCLAFAEGGLNAVLLVLSVRNRVSEEEASTLASLQVIFGSKILDYLMVVFCGGDDLEEQGTTLEGYLGGCPKFLKELLILCGQRKVLLDNRTKDAVKKAKQLGEIVSLVKQIGVKNDGKPYTNDMYHTIKEETERHMQKQKELEHNGFTGEHLAAMMKELQSSHEQNLKEISNMMVQTLRDAAQAQERVIEGLRSQNRELLSMAMQPKCNIL